MEGFMCGTLLLPDDIPDASSDEDPCCAGRAFDGPRNCECWREVFDLEQAEITEALPVPRVPLRPCEPAPGDDGCAYRGTSPERTGSSGHSGDADELDRLAASGRPRAASLAAARVTPWSPEARELDGVQPFFCHNGIRRVVALVHPSGARYVLPHNSDYRPPIRGSVPYRADGRPADICAGWLLRRLTLTRQQEEAAVCPPRR